MLQILKCFGKQTRHTVTVWRVCLQNTSIFAEFFLLKHWNVRVRPEAKILCSLNEQTRIKTLNQFPKFVYCQIKWYFLVIDDHFQHGWCEYFCITLWAWVTVYGHSTVNQLNSVKSTTSLSVSSTHSAVDHSAVSTPVISDILCLLWLPLTSDWKPICSLPLFPDIILDW